MVIATSVMPSATNLQAPARVTVAGASSRTIRRLPVLRPDDDRSVERELVSRVWAQDWDCEEDSVYDDM